MLIKRWSCATARLLKCGDPALPLPPPPPAGFTAEPAKISDDGVVEDEGSSNWDERCCWWVGWLEADDELTEWCREVGSADGNSEKVEAEDGTAEE